MTILNLIPYPKKYERIPAVVGFFLFTISGFYYFGKQNMTSIYMLGGSVALLFLIYLLRSVRKRAYERFYAKENERLLDITGSNGPAGYVREQERVVARMVNPDLKLATRLNLCAGYLANAQPEEALGVLRQINTDKLPTPTQALVVFTNMTTAYIQLRDRENATAFYQKAVAVLPDVSDVLKVAFLPTEIQYQLLCGHYERALAQLSELPNDGLDQNSQDVIMAMRIVALRGNGMKERADKLDSKLRKRNLLPSTRRLLDAPLSPPQAYTEPAVPAPLPDGEDDA